MSNQGRYLRDLSLFADLGTEPPRAIESSGGSIFRLVRNGQELEIAIKSNGTIVERFEGEEQKHISFNALLASKSFGDLGRWADSQKALLRVRKASEDIPIYGTLSDSDEKIQINDIDATFVPTIDSTNEVVKILLANGPAGIGKTGFIRALAFTRAERYRELRRPLVLHVESRGRMLQNILDLMAFSLQTLRLSVTYDQVPALVRNGLVTLAIDGFDELGDPNGYELAWAQVNELVTSVRGRGTLLLAGRETFIGRERLLGALNAVRPETDKVDTFTINPIRPQTAREWLAKQGWDEKTFSQSNISPIFEPGSYALRPFFLYELSKEGVREQIEGGQIDDLTWFLVESMIIREAGKFGKDADSASTEEQRKAFVRKFLGEVARDLAENQTEALSGDTLTWIAELSANGILPSSLIGIVRNRGNVVAFLTDDDRRGYRRFSHSQLLNHFLSRVTIDAIRNGEIPKYIRRNIFGADYLSSFSEVARNYPELEIKDFISRAAERIAEVSDQDRTRSNLAALILACLGSVAASTAIVISGVFLDEALIDETSSAIDLRSVTIAQLDARGADISRVRFDENSYISSLMADDGTFVSESFPTPRRVQLPSIVLTEPDKVSDWIRTHSTLGTKSTPAIPDSVRTHGLFKLLGRIARYKPFWIREDAEKKSRRILDDEYWPALLRVLRKHELITIREDIAASGQRSNFYHLRRRVDILSENIEIDVIESFYIDLVNIAASEK